MNLAIPKTGGKGFHLFTNVGLNVGDSVFPLIRGYRQSGRFYVIETCSRYDASMLLACTGWPSEPHIITEFYQEDGLTFIRTNRGCSPAEMYFKEIK